MTTFIKIGTHHVVAFLSNYGEQTTGMTYTSSAVMVSTFNESNSGQQADSVRNTLMVTR